MRAHERREGQQAHAAPGAIRKTDGNIIAGNLLVVRPSGAMVDADFKVSMRESNAGEYSPER